MSMIDATEVLAAGLYAASELRTDGERPLWGALPAADRQPWRKAATFLRSYVGSGSCGRHSPEGLVAALSRAVPDLKVGSGACWAFLNLLPVICDDVQ